MVEGCHPEIDGSPLCTEENAAEYRSIVGCCIWIIVLGRFDVAYATSAMNRFKMLPSKEISRLLKEYYLILRLFQREG
jgi:hypothetical protein